MLIVPLVPLPNIPGMLASHAAHFLGSTAAPP